MPSASGWQRWASCRGGGDPCFVTHDPLVDTAKADSLTAYNNAFAQTPDTGFVAGDNQLGGQTLTAGVYRFPAATTANLIGTLTLDGEGDPNAVWVFQATSSLVTAAGSQALLTGAAQPCNVFKNGALPAPFFYLEVADSPTGQSHERFRQRPESCQSVCGKPGMRWQARPLPFLQCRQPDRAARGQLSQHAGRQRLADQQRQQRRRGRPHALRMGDDHAILLSWACVRLRSDASYYLRPNQSHESLTFAWWNAPLPIWLRSGSLRLRF